jgi:hypothetical protein
MRKRLGPHQHQLGQIHVHHGARDGADVPRVGRLDQDDADLKC